MKLLDRSFRPSKTVDIAELERRDWELLLLTVFIILLLTFTVLLVNVPDLVGFQKQSPGSIFQVYLACFSVLLLIFSLYLIQKKRKIKKLMQALVNEKIRTETLNRSLDKLSSLFQVSTNIHSQTELEGVARTVVQEVVNSMDAHQSSLMLLDDLSRELSVKAFFGEGSEHVAERRVKIGESISGWVARYGEPLLLNDDESIRRFGLTYKKQPDVDSSIVVPLRVQDKILGVLCVNLVGKVHRFNESDLKLFTIFAQNAAIAIENARLHGYIQLRMSRLTKLVEVLRLLNSTHEYEKILETGLRPLPEIIDFDVAAVLVLKEKRLKILSRCPLDDLFVDQFKLQLASDIVFEQAHYVPIQEFDLNLEVISAPDGRPETLVSLDQIRSYFSLPLVINEKIGGLYYVGGRGERFLQKEELQAFSILVNNLSMAIQNVRLLEEVRSRL